MDRFDPFVKYADVYGDIINWEKDPMNKPQNQNKYFFSDGKTYYEQICKMLRLMSVFKEAFNQIYSNEDEISEAWENFVNNLSASVVEGSEPDVTLTWTDDSVNFEFTMVPGVPGEQGVGITSISFNSDYTMTITLSDGNTYTSMSLKGETGPQGPQGETGSGLQILDVYATLADLQSAHPTGQPGDAYQVGSAGNYTLYIWSSSQSAWIPAGSLGTVSPSVSNPLMDGTASAGSSDLYSRGDHVHPTDTSRASKEELDALIKTSQSLIDQSFTYRESPAIQDGLARIDKIKGNTLAFNQLIQNGNFASTSGWQQINISSFTVSNNIGSFTASAQWGRISSTAFEMVNAHKYLVIATVKGTTNNYVDTGIGSKYLTTNNEWETVSFIVEPTSTANRSINIGDKRSSGWTQVQVRNAMIVDLTLMGLTADQFKSYFPLPYYSYQSTLLPFKGTSIKTVGKNLIDNTLIAQTVNGITYTVNTDKSVTLSGTASAYSSADIRFTLPNGNYIASGTNTVARLQMRNATTDAFIKDILGDTPFTVGDQIYIRIRVSQGDTVNETVYPMVRLSSIADSTYEPYISSTTELPTLTYFPNGMKSAGNVYDELLPNKAITRVGAVNLGSLTWALNDATNHIFEATITDMNPMANYQNNFNFASSMYTPSVLGKADMPNLSVRQASNNSNHIFLKNTSYSDASSFTSAMNNVYLYYELATPTETSISPELDLSFIDYEDGTEQLLPVNGSVPVTSPILADMTYLSIDDAMEYILEKLANVPENTQQILDGLEDDVADLQTDVSALQPAVSALQTSVGNINTNIGQLSSTVAGHTSSISDMQSDITDLNTGLSNLEDTVTDNTSRIGTLESGLSTTNGNVENLSTSVSGLDSTVTAQGETVTALDNFVSNIANTRNPGYMSSDNSIGITTAFLNMTLAAGQSTWANIPLPTIMAGFIPLFVVGASTGDGSVCLFKIPSTYNQNNIYKVGVKNTSNSQVTTQVGIEILCIKQRQSQ